MKWDRIKNKVRMPTLEKDEESLRKNIHILKQYSIIAKSVKRNRIKQEVIISVSIE